VLQLCAVTDDEKNAVALDAMQKNRTFGTKSSHVGAKGQPLGISDEEYESFRRASLAGLEDAKQLIKKWRNNDTEGLSDKGFF